MSLPEWLKYIQYVKHFLWKLPYFRVTRAHFAWNFWEILMNFSMFFGLSARLRIIHPLFLNLMTGVIELQVMAWILSACHNYMGQVHNFLGVKKALKMLILTRCWKSPIKIHKFTMDAFIYLEWLNNDQIFSQKYFFNF